MADATIVLLGLLTLLAASFAGWWFVGLRRARALRAPDARALAMSLAIGAVTNFFDTLGVGSFAPTTALFRAFHLVPDRLLPGTLNVGHALPSVVQALVFIAIVEVEPRTLVLMIGAAVLGAWLGASAVARWSRRRVRLGMGTALLVAAALLVRQLVLGTPGGAEARALDGVRLAVGVAGNFALGVLMTVGVGLYAPCMILVTLLGMNAKAAFPIMMGSCAFLMPVAGVRFVAKDAYVPRAALGLTLGGVPAVLVAAFVVHALPLDAVRVLVLVVALYTAVSLLLAAGAEGRPRRQPQSRSASTPR
jgi:uncharacterized membrane protein YfcA